MVGCGRKMLELFWQWRHMVDIYGWVVKATMHSYTCWWRVKAHQSQHQICFFFFHSIPVTSFITIYRRRPAHPKFQLLFSSFYSLLFMLLMLPPRVWLLLDLLQRVVTISFSFTGGCYGGWWKGGWPVIKDKRDGLFRREENMLLSWRKTNRLLKGCP